MRGWQMTQCDVLLELSNSGFSEISNNESRHKENIYTSSERRLRNRDSGRAGKMTLCDVLLKLLNSKIWKISNNKSRHEQNICASFKRRQLNCDLEWKRRMTPCDVLLGISFSEFSEISNNKSQHSVTHRSSDLSTTVGGGELKIRCISQNITLYKLLLFQICGISNKNIQHEQNTTTLLKRGLWKHNLETKVVGDTKPDYSGGQTSPCFGRSWSSIRPLQLPLLWVVGKVKRALKFNPAADQDLSTNHKKRIDVPAGLNFSTRFTKILSFGLCQAEYTLTDTSQRSRAAEVIAIARRLLQHDSGSLLRKLPAICAVVILLSTAGCTSQFENYRLVKLPSELTAGVSVFERWDTPYGWENEGVLLGIDVFAHGSIVSQVLGPASVAYAGHEVGEGLSSSGTIVNNESKSNSNSQGGLANANSSAKAVAKAKAAAKTKGHGHGHGHNGDHGPPH